MTGRRRLIALTVLVAIAVGTLLAATQARANVIITSVTTGGADTITATTARLYGTWKNAGCPPQYRWIVLIYPSGTTRTLQVGPGQGPGTGLADGLTPATTYGYYATGTACNASDRGATASFTTLARLTVTVDTGGHVDSASGPCRSTCTFESAVGTSFTEAAVPDAGFVFAGWDGVCASQGATCVTPATGDGTAAAHFVPAHTLKISTSGDGTGTVLCAGAACGTAFAVGTHVTLTATAGTGSAFVGWKGDCSGSSATCSVTLDSDRSVQATFVKTRAVNVTIGGSGSVSGADGAIDCPTTCAATLPEGTALLLTATPATGWAFRTWTGACTGTGTCSLSIASDVAVRAAFDPVVTVRTTHRGDGRVVSSPGGIDCGRVCAHAFVRGRVVVLRAKDGKTSVFDHWSGACRGTRPACRVATLGPRTAVAVFRKR